MNRQAQPDLAAAMLKRVAIHRKLVSFLITSCATFSALVVGWSWSINGYQTLSEISIQSLDPAFDRQQFQALLAHTIRTKVSDSLLSELLNETKKTVPLQSRILGDDLEALRKAILVQISAGSNPLKIQFSLMGIGSTDEQVFLQGFTANFADELSRQSQASSGDNRFVVQNAEFARYRQVVDDLDASVEQLERKIGEVEKICGANEPQASPFRTAAHRKTSNDLSYEDIQQLQQKVSNIDLNFLHESTSELKSLLDTMATSGQPYALPKVHPVGTPQPKQLFVLSVLAAALGVVVANHFKPFATQGFSSIGDVSSKLGIPVVATLPINHGRGLGAVSESANDRKLPWANRLTRIAMGWLLAVGILIIGFCCINQEIREIFLQNPVDGLARAFWYFKR